MEFQSIFLEGKAPQVKSQSSMVSLNYNSADSSQRNAVLKAQQQISRAQTKIENTKAKQENKEAKNEHSIFL